MISSALLSLVVVATAIKFERNPQPPQYANPDQHGYRVCSSWQLADGTPLYSGCDPFSINRCGEQLKFDYRCCSGFEHSHENLGGANNPCAKLIPQFDDCPSVIEGLGFKRFAQYLKNQPEFTRNNDQPYTIFVPLPYDGIDLDRIYNGNSQAVTYHVAKGRFYADDLQTGLKLQSLFNNEPIEITRTAYGSVNVECTELSQADIECRSGLIHIIRRPLVPRSGLGGLDKSSVMSLLQTNSETREFANDLPQQLKQDLSRIEPGRFYTVTAPTSSSWLDLRLRYSQEQLQTIAAAHVSSGRKCSSNLYKSQQPLVDLQGQRMSIECSISLSGDQEVRKVIDACGAAHEFIDKQFDQFAANGVVHVIKDPAIPTSLLTLKDFIDRPECAEHHNINKFIDFIRDCDLYMTDTDQYAVIAPENEAFDWWSKYGQFASEWKRFQTDKEYRCETARYHIVKHNGNLKDTSSFSGHTEGHRSNNKENQLYETTYFTKNKMGSILNWHYSPVNNFSPIQLKGASIYKTGRINIMPERNISDILEERTDFSHTNSITKGAQMEDKVFSKHAPKNLYLVTNNKGWRDPRSAALGKDMLVGALAQYESRPDVAERFAKLNHVPLYLWGGDIGYFERNSVHKFMSTVGVELIFWMDNNGVMRIGYDGLPQSSWARVVEFNLPGRDGIIWVLDRPLECPKNFCQFQLEDKDTYTFFTAACLTHDLPGEIDVGKGFKNKPTEIAKRHPDQCVVVKQGEVSTVKDVFVDSFTTGHEH